MPKKPFTTPLTIADCHCRDCGPAIRVKTYGMAFLPCNDAELGESLEGTVAAAWWYEAGNMAHAAGFTGVHACGRSGGWLAPYYGRPLRASATPERPRYVDLSDPDQVKQFQRLIRKIEPHLAAVPEMWATALVAIT